MSCLTCANFSVIYVVSPNITALLFAYTLVQVR